MIYQRRKPMLKEARRRERRHDSVWNFYAKPILATLLVGAAIGIAFYYFLVG